MLVKTINMIGPIIDQHVKRPIRLMVLISLRRGCENDCHFMVRKVMFLKSCKSYLLRLLQVYRSEATKNEQMFGYEGPVISNKLSNSEMLEEGKFLLLTDAQLKLVKTEDTIFEYNVEVFVKPRLSKQAGTAEIEKNGGNVTNGSDTSGGSTEANMSA